MFIHTIDPVLVNLGPLQIHYYGLFYLIGTLFVYLFLRYFAKQGHIKYTEDEIQDAIFYGLVGGIIGARMFYLIVYGSIDSVLDIFAVWKGGMSWHGGIIGGVTGFYLFCRKYKKSFLHLMDHIAIPFALALALGRIGNFINSELYGSITDASWGVNFNGEKDTAGNLIFRHPSQLYESAKNVLIFCVLFFLHRKGKQQPGTLMFSFLIMYAILRSLIEFIRLPDAHIGYLWGGLTMGQLLNIPIFLIGLVGLIYIHKKN